MRSVMCRVLALLLVPVLLLASSVEAGAEPRYGDGDTISYEHNYATAIPGGAAVVKCSVPFTWELPDPTHLFFKVGTARCTAGWYLNTGEPRVQVVAKGNSATGGECQADSGIIVGRFDEAFGNLSVPVPAYDCVFNEVCISVALRGGVPNYDGSFYRGPFCQGTDIGGPVPDAQPEPPAGCDQFNVSTPVVGSPELRTVGNNRAWGVQVTLTVQGLMAGDIRIVGLTTKGTKTAGAYFPFKEEVVTNGSPLVAPLWGQHIKAAGGFQPTTVAGVTTSFTEFILLSDWVSRFSAAPTVASRAVGVSIYAPNKGGSWTMHTRPYSATGMVGMTVPGLCSFYWGEKISNVSPPLVGDEPIADLALPESPPEVGNPEPPDLGEDDPSPEVETQESCSFKFQDPSTWLNAGMCAAVGLLGKLLGLMQDLIEAVLGLVGKLATMLQTLFVPSEDSFDVQGIKDQASSRPPFSVIEGIGTSAVSMGTGYSSAGGCSGDVLDLGQVAGESARVTCAKVTSVPGYGGLYSIVQIGLWALTAWGLFMVGSRSLRGGE